MKRGNNPYDSLVSFISRCNISTREEVRLREIISDIKKFDESTPVTGESEAIAFAEWAGSSYSYAGDNIWEGDDDDTITTSELYNLYKQSKK
jgi:hypothetical protein